MATATTTRFSVQVREDAALGPGAYRFVLELDNKTVDRVPPAAGRPPERLAAEFAVADAGAGRLTIEKERLLAVNSSFAIEESYEFSVEFTGKQPLGFRFITAQPGKFACPTAEEAAAVKTAPPAPSKVRPVKKPPGVTLEQGKDGGWTLKLTISEPADATGDLKKVGPSGAARWRPVAQVFVGKDPARHALVFAGMHGNEPEGTRVVSELLNLLRARGPAAFTTVIIPVLIPRTSQGPDDAGPRYVRSATNGGSLIEPNRNFPMAGQSHATARELGLWYPKGAEFLFCRAPKPAPAKGKAPAKEHASPPKGDLTSTRFIAETSLLVALIEELKPERILSIHAHQQIREFTKAIGNNSGIFVDPRPGFEKEDDALALAMIQSFDAKYANAKAASARAQAAAGSPLLGPDFSWDPLRGNRSFTFVPGRMGVGVLPVTNVRYASDDKTGAPPGTSFGTWGPRQVLESFVGVSLPRGNRPGAPVITVECPLADEGDRRRLEIQAEQLAAGAAGVPTIIAPVQPALAVAADATARAQRAAAKTPRISVADGRIVESVHAEVIYEVFLGGPAAP